MFKKVKEIIFISQNDLFGKIYDPPEPAKKNLPEWYKKQDKIIGDSLTIDNSTGNPNLSIKSCMPVFDIITAGYLVRLPADILVKNNPDGSKSISWSTNDLKLIESHPTTQYDKLKVPLEYENEAYKFVQPWIFKTPPGYSCIIMQPSLRDDLPFQIVPALVDTDKHPIPINFPFFLRKDFEGIIETNTPIAQIIPFKREDWKSSVDSDSDGSIHNLWVRAERKLMNRYKTFIRSSKRWD
jgi:hypothetical protein